MADFESVVLRDPSSSLTATYVPGAGMICTSLADDGVEFLGQRRGLQAYVSDGKTMGIPLLYPWANRLGESSYTVDGAVVTLASGTNGVRGDANGLPIHGVLAANSGWLVTEQTDNTLVATMDWSGAPRLLASFPFPHMLTMSVTLLDRALTVATTVRPTTAASVPLCFGYHPYFQIPGVARAEWELATPSMRHLVVDDQGLPTGETGEWPSGAKPLGEDQLDDGFDAVADGAVFTLSGGGRAVEVTFTQGYHAAQLFAPGGDDLVAIEPMAAPTDALRRGGYPVAVPGHAVTSTFAVRVS